MNPTKWLTPDGKIDWGMMFSDMFPYLASGGVGYLIDENNSKNSVQPKDAVAQQNQRYGDIQQMLQGITSGTGQVNPNLEQARKNFTQRVNTPVNAPQVFNPYQKDPNYGQPNPQLLAQIMKLSQPSQQTQAQGWLNQSLMNRNTPRPMIGG